MNFHRIIDMDFKFHRLGQIIQFGQNATPIFFSFSYNEGNSNIYQTFDHFLLAASCVCTSWNMFSEWIDTNIKT